MPELSADPPFARFDDVCADEALVFPSPERVIVARTATDVRTVLAEVEAATNSGQWAFGFLTYEAGIATTALEPAYEPSAADVPLAWFGLGGAPSRTSAVKPVDGERQYWTAPWVLDWTANDHATAVQHVQDLIAAGGIYQANITTTLRSRVLGDLGDCYADLVHAQSGRHNAYLDTGADVVLSASPELFFDWTPPLLQCRPMKGTARRGDTPAADEANRLQLSRSSKDIAENIMIVDLVRNDLGRLATIGSVRVPRLLTTERFNSVWQLTSDVLCEPVAGTTLTDVLAALFPGGSVTGAPKLAAMQVIDAVESGPRGVYCGAIGWVAPPAEPTRARFSIAIRSMVVDRSAATASYGAGGGITASSRAADEYAELIDKTAILNRPDDVPLQLLETLAYRRSGGFSYLERHLDRLLGSAAVFGIAVDRDLIAAALADAVHGWDEARVALRVDTHGRPTVALAPMPTASTTPVTLAVDTVAVRSDSLWLRHKTNRRAAYESARARHPDAGDVVLVNERGELTETTIASIALCCDGRWLTPELASGCLPGVGRAAAIDEGQLTAATLNVTDLKRCTKLAVLSSLRGWRAARLR